MPSLSLFSFESQPIRTLTIDGNSWFVGKDICDVLGYANHNDAIAKHCRGVATRYPLQTAGGTQEIRIINEPDTYRLITGSTLPEAERFERWLFEELLPTLRKTGRYEFDSSVSHPATINAIIDQLRVNRPSIPPLWLVMMWTLLEEIDQRRYPHPWAIRAVKDVHCLVFRPGQAVAYLSTAKHLQHLWQQTDPLGDRLLKRLLRQAGAIVKSRCDFTIGLQRFNHAIAIDLEALRPHKALPT